MSLVVQLIVLASLYIVFNFLMLQPVLMASIRNRTMSYLVIMGILEGIVLGAFNMFFMGIFYVYICYASNKAAFKGMEAQASSEMDLTSDMDYVLVKNGNSLRLGLAAIICLLVSFFSGVSY